MAQSATTRNGNGKSKTRPVHEIRLGRVKAAIWANQTESGLRHNVTVRRIYTDAEGKWQSSETFGRDDLPLLVKVVDLAHDWIYQQSASQTEGHETGTDQEIPY